MREHDERSAPGAMLEAAREILGRTVDIFSRFSRLERVPRRFGTPDLLYPAEIHTIAFIGDHPGCRAKDVADALHVTKGAVSQTLARLAAKGLLESTRRIDARASERTASAPGRAGRLEITDRGRTAYRSHAAMHERIEATFAVIIGEVSPQELARVTAISDQVIDLLDRALATEGLPL